MLRFGHWLALRITPLARCVGLSRSRVKFDIIIIIIVLNWNIFDAIALCFFLIFFFSFGAFPRKPHSRNQKLALPGWNRCQKTMDGIFVGALLHFHGIMWLSDHRETQGLWQRRQDRTLDQLPAIAANRTNVNPWQWQWLYLNIGHR